MEIYHNCQRTVSSDDCTDAVVLICVPLTHILLILKHRDAHALPHALDPLSLIEGAWQR